MRLFSSKEEADEADVPEDEQFIIGWRTEAERDAILLAAQFGNRTQRRAGTQYNERDGKDKGPVDISRAERNRRNAKRRTAKKSRRANR